MKQIIQNYVFNPAARTITLPGYRGELSLIRLGLITNVSTGTIIYHFADPAKGATINGNVITLKYDTRSMSANADLRIDYNTAYGDASNDALTITNSRSKFRDGFATASTTQPNPEAWDLQEDTPGAHIITQGGDSSGSSYLRISLSPFVEANDISLTSKRWFQFPMRVGFGISMSQRIVGQEVFIGMAGCDRAGAIETITQTPDKSITGATASVTSNIATFTMTRHGFSGGDRVVLFGCTDHRLNVGPVTITVLTADTFSIPLSIGNGTYNSTGGAVRTADPLRNLKNGGGLLFENSSANNASFVSRRNGAKFRSTNSTIASTTAQQLNTNPYTDAFVAAGNQELYFTMDELSWRSYSSDSNANIQGSGKYTQNVPEEEMDYKIYVRAKNLNGFSLPVGRIVSVTKTASATAVVTTDTPHTLAVGDFVQIYGVQSQANFPQLSTQTAITAVNSPTSFSVPWGASATASSANGVVWSNQGQVAAPGVVGQSAQSISRVNGVLTVIGNTTWSGPLPGEFLQLHGLDTAAQAYEGAYKVLRTSGTTLELEAPGPDFTSITTGGAVIRRTDVRLHFARVMDYTRLGVEVLGGKGNTSDINNAVPVSVTGSSNISVTQSSGTNSTVWNAAGFGGFLVADIASAAITTTTISGAITPASVANIGTYSHTFSVPVTAVTGTNPALDIAIEESPDNGTNWIRVYEFPRITATGVYVTPKLMAQYGTRYRYVRTVSGTSPSFTMALNRIQWSTPGELINQFFDRTISLTTLNAVTPSYNVDGAAKLQLTVNLGVATTPPQLVLEGSEDGTFWYQVAAPLVTVASSTVNLAVTHAAYPKFVRVRVSTAGSGVTPGYVSIKALGT